MKKHNLAFIDLETTGVNPQKHEIIEMGIVIAKQVPQPGKGCKIEKIEEMEMKVKPTRLEDAEEEALRINRYSDAEWLFASDLQSAMNTFMEKTKDCIIVAQNVTFDWAFIVKALSDLGIEDSFYYHKLDLASFALGRLYDDTSVQKFSLRALCEEVGVKNDNAHTALSDARATFEIYKRLAEK